MAKLVINISKRSANKNSMKPTLIEQQKYRKHQNNLMVVGLGIIMFSIWSVVNVILCTTLDKVYLYETYLLEDNDDFTNMVFIVVLFTVTVINVWLRIKIARQAIIVAKGGKLETIYYPIIIFYILIMAVLVVASFDFNLSGRLLEEICSFLLDCFSVGLTISMMFSVFWINNYRKKFGLKPQEGAK